MNENNDREFRQQKLKEILNALHDGKPVDDVKKQFAAVFSNVDAKELAEAEHALVREGMPIAEIQRLCDVHAAVVGKSVESIHAPTVNDTDYPGHPLSVLRQENTALRKLVEHLKEVFPKLPATHTDFLESMGKLSQIEQHYLRKETLLFPMLERHGIDTPPKVMWGVHDEIRLQLKSLKKALSGHDFLKLKSEFEPLLDKINDMIDKEAQILVPMALGALTDEEWAQVAAESKEIGWCLIDPPPDWGNIKHSPQPEKENGLHFAGGTLSAAELTAILDALPMELTFVGKDDTMRYFSHKGNRILSRTVAAVGRNVENCHPPAIAHQVMELIESLKAGHTDSEHFWFQLGDRTIYNTYKALRDQNGEYLGILEMTQDISPLQAVQGEKRLTKQ